MGADRLIGGAPQPGGITFEEIEDLRIDLGLGNDKFTIDQTHTGKTTVNTNRGNDEVYVKTISGHTFVNLGAGSDTLTITSDAQKLDQLLGLLTVSGDVPRAEMVTLAKGFAAVPAESVAKVDEIQQLTIDATGGTFTLALGSLVTSVALAYNARCRGRPGRARGATRAGRRQRPRWRKGRQRLPGDLHPRHARGSDVALLSANELRTDERCTARSTRSTSTTTCDHPADTWALLTSSSLTGPEPAFSRTK